MPSIASLDRQIRSRHLLTHPFYVEWSQGEVSMDTLRNYAGQYYQFERNFPRYVAGAYARVLDPERRRVLLSNLMDEEGRDPTHPELWLRFAEAIGADRRQVRESAANPATRALLRTYERFALRGDAAGALGALYAYESIFPEVAAEKSRGLRTHYGVRSARAHEFFRVHSVADLEHAEAERRLLREEIGGSRTSGRSAEVAVDATVTAWWKFLDAFCG
jgi:pyrroloquinoline-quinone synthase